MKSSDQVTLNNNIKTDKFIDTLISIEEEYIPKSITSSKKNRPWFNENSKKKSN